MERRHKSAEVVAKVVLVAIEYARDEVIIISNVPRLPQIMREQLRYPVQRWAFPAAVALGATLMGVNTWLLMDNPVPGVILGAYAQARSIIAKSVF